MPRLQLELKEEFFCFSTTHRVRMSEINAEITWAMTR